MNKRTQSKHARALREQLGVIQQMDGEKVVKEVPRYDGKIIGYKEPTPFELRDAQFGGVVMQVKVFPGQRINLRREYKRQKALGLL